MILTLIVFFSFVNFQNSNCEDIYFGTSYDYNNPLCVEYIKGINESFKYINNFGGILNNKKLYLIEKNDMNNETKIIENTENLNSQDEIFGLLGYCGNHLYNFSNEIFTNVIAPWIGSNYWNKKVIKIKPSFYDEIFGLINLMLRKYYFKISIFYNSKDDTGVFLNNIVNEILEEKFDSLQPCTSISLKENNLEINETFINKFIYSCQNKQASPDIILLLTDIEDTNAFFDKYEELFMDKKFNINFAVTSLVSANLLNIIQKNFSNDIIFPFSSPYYDSSKESLLIENYHETFQVENERTSFSIEGFLAGFFIKDIVTNMFGNITKLNLINSIYSFKNYYVDDVILGDFDEVNKCNVGYQNIDLILYSGVNFTFTEIQNYNWRLNDGCNIQFSEKKIINFVQFISNYHEFDFNIGLKKYFYNFNERNEYNVILRLRTFIHNGSNDIEDNINILIADNKTRNYFGVFNDSLSDFIFNKYFKDNENLTYINVFNGNELNNNEKNYISFTSTYQEEIENLILYFIHKFLIIKFTLVLPLDYKNENLENIFISALDKFNLKPLSIFYYENLNERFINDNNVLIENSYLKTNENLNGGNFIFCFCDDNTFLKLKNTLNESEFSLIYYGLFSKFSHDAINQNDNYKQVFRNQLFDYFTSSFTIVDNFIQEFNSIQNDDNYSVFFGFLFGRMIEKLFESQTILKNNNYNIHESLYNISPFKIEDEYQIIEFQSDNNRVFFPKKIQNVYNQEIDIVNYNLNFPYFIGVLVDNIDAEIIKYLNGLETVLNERNVFKNYKVYYKIIRFNITDFLDTYKPISIIIKTNFFKYKTNVDIIRSYPNVLFIDDYPFHSQKFEANSFPDNIIMFQNSIYDQAIASLIFLNSYKKILLSKIKIIYSKNCDYCELAVNGVNKYQKFYFNGILIPDRVNEIDDVQDLDQYDSFIFLTTPDYQNISNVLDKIEEKEKKIFMYPNYIDEKNEIFNNLTFYKTSFFKNLLNNTFYYQGRINGLLIENFIDYKKLDMSKIFESSLINGIITSEISNGCNYFTKTIVIQKKEKNEDFIYVNEQLIGDDSLVNLCHYYFPSRLPLYIFITILVLSIFSYSIFCLCFSCFIICRCYLYRKKRVYPKVRRGRGLYLCFTDIQGSTKLWNECPNAIKKGMKIHNSVMRKWIKIYNGYEVKTIGDAFFIVFRSPTCAINFAFKVQEDLMNQKWNEKLLMNYSCRTTWDDNGEISHRGLRVRIILHYSDKLQRMKEGGRYDYLGNGVNKAARLEHKCEGGKILVSKQFKDRMYQPDICIMMNEDNYELSSEYSDNESDYSSSNNSIRSGNESGGSGKSVITSISSDASSSKKIRRKKKRNGKLFVDKIYIERLEKVVLKGIKGSTKIFYVYSEKLINRYKNEVSKKKENNLLEDDSKSAQEKKTKNIKEQIKKVFTRQLNEMKLKKEFLQRVKKKREEEEKKKLGMYNSRIIQSESNLTDVAENFFLSNPTSLSNNSIVESKMQKKSINKSKKGKKKIKKSNFRKVVPL